MWGDSPKNVAELTALLRKQLKPTWAFVSLCYSPPQEVKQLLDSERWR